LNKQNNSSNNNVSTKLDFTKQLMSQLNAPASR